jgi:hypothetical protein
LKYPVTVRKKVENFQIECEKRAISQCASFPCLPPSLVDVINVIGLEGILEQGKRVVITTQSPLQVHKSAGALAVA